MARVHTLLQRLQTDAEFAAIVAEFAASAALADDPTAPAMQAALDARVARGGYSWWDVISADIASAVPESALDPQ